MENVQKKLGKISNSTQKFTEIETITDNVVLFSNGSAALVIETWATNFSLLSQEEQDAKLLAYASLLNSLSFPIQIIIRSKKLDISSYLKLLEDESAKSQSHDFSQRITLYKKFVEELIKINTVLDKKFYIVIPYSSFENPVNLKNIKKSADEKNRHLETVKISLMSKAGSLHSELKRLNLRSKTLENDGLISLFHDFYNESSLEEKNREFGKEISVPDTIAPSSIEVDFNFVRVGDRFYKTYFVVGYPRYATVNWLSPLINFEHSMNIGMFIYPASSPDVLSNIRRKIAEMEATITSEIEDGKEIDPKVSASLEDALSVQEQLAKGVERFFEFCLYITLSSNDKKELEEAGKKLNSTLSSLLIFAKGATLQMEEGFKSTIPAGQDKLYIARNMDTTSLASTFPFTSATLTQDKGIMFGVNQQNESLIIFDRYSLENANEVVLGKSGAGKSYLIKLEVMRQFMFGTEVIIIDPEGEYEVLAKTLGGEYVGFNPTEPIKINPFDLSGLYEEGENELGLKILSLHALIKILMGGGVDPSHDAILDRALVETYRKKGITTDPSTQTKEPPIMQDLYDTLSEMNNPQSQELTLRLEKFIKGSLSGLFNQQSNFDIKNPLTVFSIRDLEDELRPIAMHIILDFVWTKVRRDLKKRLLILDEAWYLMKYEDSASFVYSIAKRARKYFLALTTATQDVQDFLTTNYGKAVLSNSSLQILLKQSPSEIDLVSEVFYLSKGEKDLLLSTSVGEGLFFAGLSHVAIKVFAAPFEHAIITSNGAETLKAQDTNLETPIASPGQISETPQEFKQQGNS